MIAMRTKVKVKGISGKSISVFMLTCTNDDYQNWWPGTHLSFHTSKRFPKDLGNLVYFDEYIGRRRFKFDGVVVKNKSGKELTWQMKRAVRLPAWLVLEFDDGDDGVVITHILKVGFVGIGMLLDPILRLYLTKGFEKDIEEHARTEFTKLATILSREQ
jgi:hypothetical protein